MHRETEFGGNAKPRDHLTKPRGRERRSALRREDKRRCRILLAFEPAQGPQLAARQRMDRFQAALDAIDVNAVMTDGLRSGGGRERSQVRAALRRR